MYPFEIAVLADSIEFSWKKQCEGEKSSSHSVLEQLCLSHVPHSVSVAPCGCYCQKGVRRGSSLLLLPFHTKVDCLRRNFLQGTSFKIFFKEAIQQWFGTESSEQLACCRLGIASDRDANKGSRFESSLCKLLYRVHITMQTDEISLLADLSSYHRCSYSGGHRSWRRETARNRFICIFLSSFSSNFFILIYLSFIAKCCLASSLLLQWTPNSDYGTVAAPFCGPDRPGKACLVRLMWFPQCSLLGVLLGPVWIALCNTQCVWFGTLPNDPHR